MYAKTEQKLLVFVPLQFTDDQTIACRNERILNELGTISLSLYFGKLDNNPMLKPTYSTGPVDQSPIHRALEAELDMTERTSSGPKQKIPKQEWYGFDYSDALKTPVAEFRFYYRSAMILQRRGYMPASPPLSRSSTLLVSSPAKSYRDPDATASDDELAEQLRTQRKRVRDEREQLRELESSWESKRSSRSRSDTPASE